MDIDDTTLHAWFDGELPPGQADAVEAQVREQPELAARVRLWQADREALRAQFDATLLEPVPLRLTETLQQAAAPRQRLPLWAAGVALFLLGGATGAVLMTSLGGAGPRGQLAAGDWLQRAAVAHALYTPEKRHPVEVSVEQNQDGHLARWLTRRLDVPVKLFDLAPQGFELVGGRLLPDAGRPSAQLMYQNAGGQRVTVYLRKAEAATVADASSATFRFERQGELGVFYWVEGQGAAAAGYALVGSLPREQLVTLAEAIYQQGGAAPAKPTGP